MPRKFYIKKKQRTEAVVGGGLQLGSYLFLCVCFFTYHVCVLFGLFQLK